MLTLLKVVRAYAPDRIEENPQKHTKLQPCQFQNFQVSHQPL